MALMHKFRPKSWAEVVGQSTVVSILQRQVATRTWKNAYLFCGAFGTGKTTVARIFANDINNNEGEPIEIDAASNNGVEAIRSLIADAQQVSLVSDFKVYIIDEAHMITNAGWNAALKLIEEPPVGTVFIFCTTNPEKIPGTIMSRVQRFDFKKIPTNIIADRLEFIMNEEACGTYEKLALEKIASNAEGHLRDALQMLDKCLDVSTNITVDLVDTVLGLVSTDSTIAILKNVSEKNLDGCMEVLSSLDSYNVDFIKYYDRLISFVLDCIIFKKTSKVVYTDLPKSIINELPLGSNLIEFSERLLNYRKYINQTNAFIFMKSIFIEMCTKE